MSLTIKKGREAVNWTVVRAPHPPCPLPRGKGEIKVKHTGDTPDPVMGLPPPALRMEAGGGVPPARGLGCPQTTK